MYIWWARVAATSGLASADIAARPGSIGLIAAIAGLLGVQMLVVVSALMTTLL